MDAYTTGKYDEPLLTDISLLEPETFTTQGIRAKMINREQGCQKIFATVKQPAGDVSCLYFLIYFLFIFFFLFFFLN